MNTNNIVGVSAIPQEAVAKAIANRIHANDGAFDSIASAFELGCMMADFHCASGPDRRKIGPDYTVREAFLHLTSATFLIDGEPNQIADAGTTIAYVDAKNSRIAFVVVIRPGKNAVFFQKSEYKAAVGEIDLIADRLYRESVRIEGGWRDFQNFDKIAVACLFGFEYDKKDDLILVPPAKVENSIKMMQRVALEMQT